MTEGGGARRPLAQPSRTMISHARASVTGTARPKIGRMNRARRLTPDRSCAGVPSAARVMLTTDMVQWPNAIRQNYLAPLAGRGTGGQAALVRGGGRGLKPLRE